MNITFTYANVRVDNDPADLWTIDFDMEYDGDTYQVTVEWNEDPDMGRAIDVTLDGVDQYWALTDGGGPFGAGEPADTHLSRTIDTDELYEWVQVTILDPIWDAQRKAVRAMQGATGTVTWEDR